MAQRRIQEENQKMEEEDHYKGIYAFNKIHNYGQWSKKKHSSIRDFLSECLTQKNMLSIDVMLIQYQC